MLRASADDNPADWPNRLPALLAAYRMTPHSITLGREVLLPCTLIDAPPESDTVATVPFVQSFRDTLRDAHTRATANLQLSAKTQEILRRSYPSPQIRSRRAGVVVLAPPLRKTSPTN